MAIAKN